MIAILTPSRERPQQMAEMVDATLSTLTGQARIYCGLDDDDPTIEEYHDLLWGSPGFVHMTGPRQQLAGWTNTLAKKAIADGAQILASFGDDHRPRTQGWDTRIYAAFSKGAGLVYTADGLQDERLPTAPFWSYDIIEALGWFFPPVLRHLYADDFWLRFARDIGRCTYLPDVLIEHLHPSATGEEPDAINLENDSHYGEDRAAFEAFVASDEYRDCVERVKAIL